MAFAQYEGPEIFNAGQGPVYVTNLPPGVKRHQDHYKYVPLMVPLIGHALRQTNLGTMALGSKGFHPTAHRSFFITGGCYIILNPAVGWQNSREVLE